MNLNLNTFISSRKLVLALLTCGQVTGPAFAERPAGISPILVTAKAHSATASAYLADMTQSHGTAKQAVSGSEFGRKLAVSQSYSGTNNHASPEGSAIGGVFRVYADKCAVPNPRTGWCGCPLTSVPRPGSSKGLVRCE